MEDHIRKVMDLREVEPRDRTRLYYMLQAHLHEQAEIAGHPQAPTQEIPYPGFKDFALNEGDRVGYILEHESEIAGFVFCRYQSAEELELSELRASRLLVLVEIYLSPGHRGEGISQFVHEQMLEAAQRKRMPMTWTSLQADREANRLYDRFCRWAARTKGFKHQRLETTDTDGNPRYRYVLRLQ
ncbi:MAG: hypothetical protein B1H03_03185 [Planctomycetales bacterium 4484_113]|nr:MAG: hypothetical protein B1H03_03185 [Planctomycetales bacterium 4484_113]